MTAALHLVDLAGLEARQPVHDVLLRLRGRAQVAFRHDAVDGRAIRRSISWYSRRLSFDSQYDHPLAVHVGEGHGDDDGHLVELAALAVDATDELVVLGPGPGQAVDDQLLADLLQTVDARADTARGDEDVDVAVLLEKLLEIRAVGVAG